MRHAGAMWGVIVGMRPLKTRFDRRVGSFLPLDWDAVECYVYKHPKRERVQGCTILGPKHSTDGETLIVTGWYFPELLFICHSQKVPTPERKLELEPGIIDTITQVKRRQ